MGARFSDVITTEAEMRAVVGQPSNYIRTKASATLDGHSKSFIAHCPFLLIASADADGNLDISPKGDPPGFVRVLDDSTLAIPDRPGNRRVDTFSNLLQRPQVGLLFLVPGKPHTLRANGTARIVRDKWIRDEMAIGGKAPDLALIVTVTEVFFHCPKCIVRSKLWEPGQWLHPDALPSFARIKVERGGFDMSVEAMEALVAKNIREQLY